MKAIVDLKFVKYNVFRQPKGFKKSANFCDKNNKRC